jgi:hypothetical protein
MDAFAPAKDVCACSFNAWYARFEPLTYKSRVIPVPGAFLDFLVSDTVFVPTSLLDSALSDDDDWADDDNSGGGGNINSSRSRSSSSSSSRDGGGDAEAAARRAEVDACVGHVCESVAEAMASLGEGPFFCKLNWSSPRDAAWANADNSMRCLNPADVLLLLQSSDCIAHDCCQAFGQCPDIIAAAAAATAAAATADAAASSPSGAATSVRNVACNTANVRQVASSVMSSVLASQTAVLSGNNNSSFISSDSSKNNFSADPDVTLGPHGVLVVRKYMALNPGFEFRAFVRDGGLVAVCQRNTNLFLDYLTGKNHPFLLPSLSVCPETNTRRTI